MNELVKQGRGKNDPTWYPSLRQMLAHFLKGPKIPVSRLARQRLHKLNDDKNYTVLDGVMHNRFETAHAVTVRDVAGALEEILTLVLAEPTPPSKPAGRGRE
jgi:hypothetical protein